MLQQGATASASSRAGPFEQARRATTGDSTAKPAAKAVSRVLTATQTGPKPTSPHVEASSATFSAAATHAELTHVVAAAGAGFAQRPETALTAEARTQTGALPVSPSKQVGQTAVATTDGGYGGAEAAISTGRPSRCPTTAANTAATPIGGRPKRAGLAASSPSLAAEAREAATVTSPKTGEARAGRSSQRRTQEVRPAVLSRPAAAQAVGHNGRFAKHAGAADAAEGHGAAVAVSTGMDAVATPAGLKSGRQVRHAAHEAVTTTYAAPS